MLDRVRAMELALPLGLSSRCGYRGDARGLIQMEETSENHLNILDFGEYGDRNLINS